MKSAAGTGRRFPLLILILSCFENVAAATGITNRKGEEAVFCCHCCCHGNWCWKLLTELLCLMISVVTVSASWFGVVWCCCCCMFGVLVLVLGLGVGVALLYNLKDREEITLDTEGEAIGPTDEAVNNLSKFLGIGIKDKEAIWEYVQVRTLLLFLLESIWKCTHAKFIIPTEGKRMVLARINDNWRRYKTTIKRTHFLPYKCVNEMLKNRPKSIPESHFRNLVAYWRTEKVKAASKENNEPPTQAEMFVETRQSTKEKSLDEDTLDVIAHLQAENKKSKELAIRAFRSIFGKEKAGRVRCHGRVTTPTLLKKNEEIATLKQQHATEKATLENKVDVM
ncbi:hypothetical protein Ahy_B06g083418 [Arachis hypogaea]|uniref:Uncharacterized protein n=1 Tax=Arachis hypogaea TaxID=3818 RepID=A0A444YPR5_ARAHY|nr:hypothetical protein Ahy_B06g083418 [Arachis hypogaea]